MDIDIDVNQNMDKDNGINLRFSPTRREVPHSTHGVQIKPPSLTTADGSVLKLRGTNIDPNMVGL